jgi:hypothetical protein
MFSMLTFAYLFRKKFVFDSAFGGASAASTLTDTAQKHRYKSAYLTSVRILLQISLF